jgi:Icc-related predicted phosphoesterase
MKFLFSSDFHSHEPVFRSFADTLGAGAYEAGILAGDLLDEWLPPEEVERWLAGQGSPASAADRLALALGLKQRHLQGLLERAGKPIFFVLGNHDVTPWPDSPLMTNLHDKAVEHRGLRLAGSRWTRMDRYPDELEADVPALAGRVDDATVLVTHSPPWGVLDGVPGARFRFGLKTLHRVARPRWHLFGHVHECAGIEGSTVNGAWPALRKFFVVDAGSGRVTLAD